MKLEQSSLTYLKVLIKYGMNELFINFRSILPEVFCKKSFLRNFAKFTGKQRCQSLFFNKVAGLRTATLFKKRLWHRCFPVNFSKFLRTLFFIEHLWWLLLKVLRILVNLKKHLTNFLENRKQRVVLMTNIHLGPVLKSESHLPKKN